MLGKGDIFQDISDAKWGFSLKESTKEIKA